MKSIEIDGKEYALHFGLDFIREMDKRYQMVTSSGLSFGVGLQYAVVYLQDYNPTILEDIILSATHTLDQIPSHEGIENWIESQKNLEKVFDDFLSTLKKSPLTKPKVKTMLD